MLKYLIILDVYYYLWPRLWRKLLGMMNPCVWLWQNWLVPKCIHLVIELICKLQRKKKILKQACTIFTEHFTCFSTLRQQKHKAVWNLELLLNIHLTILEGIQYSHSLNERRLLHPNAGKYFYYNAVFKIQDQWRVSTSNVVVCSSPERAVTQHEQQRTSVSSGVSVRWWPPSRCYRGHALPEVLARWAHHVDPCVSGHHHTQVSGICLH